jgi:ferritin-like metal-binding protein YciE
MSERTFDEQLTKYLTDAHSIEEQALVQMRMAPGIAGDDRLAALFREHLVETEDHERRTRERLEARGAAPSKLKDVVMKAGGVGFALFAKSQPDSPGKLTAHAYSYEHLELASYELLARVAERAGDEDTATAARSIREQERAMADRLAASFDVAAQASLREKGAAQLSEDVVKYLADAHAIENQAIQLLERAPKIAGDATLQELYREHLEETREQARMVDDRLQALGGSPSRLKDAAMRLGAINWGTFFQSHPDTPGKLAAFAYAFEHLEIGGYELLRRVADQAGDHETAVLAQTIGAQERAAAEKIAGTWDRAVDASLREVGVTAGAGA